MTRTRLFRALDEGRTPVGTIALAGNAPMVEIMGNVGMDFACIDTMLTENDWTEVGHMIRAAERYQLTPWVRIQAYPWVDSPIDSRTVADVMRALSIGAEMVSVSVNSAEDVRRIIHPLTDWHRRVYLVQPEAHEDEHDDVGSSGIPSPLVFPQIESAAGARNIDEIVEVPGLKAVFLGMGDLSRSLGHPGEYDHPEVRAFVVRAIEAAHAHGQVVIVNTGYELKSEGMADAVKALSDIGVDIVWVPYFGLVLDDVYRTAIDLFRAGEAHRATG